MEYYLYVLIKFILGFFILITYLNLTGKTQLSQFTPIDFIGNFIMGGVIGGVIYNTDIRIYEYVLVLLVGTGLMSILNLMSRHIPAFRRLAVGRPIPIIKNGCFLMEEIKKKQNKIDISNIASQLRTQGVYSFNGIYYAQIEPNGQITVIDEKNQMPSILLIKNGMLMKKELTEINKDESWIFDQMRTRDIDDIKAVFLAEYWKNEVRFVLQDGRVC